MDTEGKGKMSLMAAGGFTLLGVVLTVAALSIPAVRRALGGSPGGPTHQHATITLLNNSGASGPCDFKANHGGSDVAAKFPFLRVSSGDDIDWIVKDGRSGHHNPQNFTISFPSSAGGSPFSNNTYQSPGGHRTSPAAQLTTTTYGDYQYASIDLVADDGQQISCSNARDPGVQVDQ